MELVLLSATAIVALFNTANVYGELLYLFQAFHVITVPMAILYFGTRIKRVRVSLGAVNAYLFVSSVEVGCDILSVVLRVKNLEHVVKQLPAVSTNYLDLARVAVVLVVGFTVVDVLALMVGLWMRVAVRRSEKVFEATMTRGICPLQGPAGRSRRVAAPHARAGSAPPQNSRDRQVRRRPRQLTLLNSVNLHFFWTPD